jgi:hypothetical protein
MWPPGSSGRLRESVCQQCHLQAVIRTVKHNRRQEDFRPGLPLSEFVSFFVFPPKQADTKRAVGHVEQMYASRCFQASGRKLGCLSCHDPHNYPPANEKPKFYRDRCRWPEDMPAWEAKGYALMLQDRNEESLRAFSGSVAVSAEP